MKKLKFIKYIKTILLKFLSVFRKKNKEKSIVKENKIVLSAGIDTTIFEDKNLKANEKFYLMVLINSYNNKLGYAEISIDQIKDAANSKNNNTTIDIINRLEEKGYIKNIQIKKGVKARYVILKHIEIKDSSNRDRNLVDLKKQSNKIIKDGENEIVNKNVNEDNKQFHNYNNHNKSDIDILEKKINFHENLDILSLIRKIQQELKVEYNLLRFMADKNNNVSNEIKNYLKDKE